jgi:predicted aminopeptidase
LGWFQDPVLSTFVHRSETGLAGLIFHELAHKTLYVQDDTFFNEAFAMTVEQEGVRRWLVETGRPEAFGRYRLHRKRRREFIGLVVAARDQLAEVYQSPVEAAAKREAKARIIEELRARYQELKRSWDGYSGYDAWFASDINNAKLAGLAVYHRWVPAFQSLLAECGGDLEAFYQACQRLADLDPDQRRRRLERRLQADPAPAGVSVEGAGKATPQAKASSSW